MMIDCTPELTIARGAMPTPGFCLPTAVQQSAAVKQPVVHFPEENQMMQNFRKITGGVLLAASLLLTGGQALAADMDKPVGKVAITEKQFGLVVGGSTGSGTLTFKKKQYPFKIKGLSAGLNVGFSKMSAAGDVYAMKKISDFPGTYTKLEASIAVGGGVGGLRLQNENGVIMNLRSRTKGLDLNLGNVTGLTVTMD